eukprot:CAMPEP_0183713584 /NCGR_PEP_ID=MMETSP0737-20130205/8389_1 /TAXON_ID=385413 /ORGANISM="Thalassiosira miniscula, Strain CCMP1093" /LENGTH=370 /DNA_ID=CAMNT_0025942385 /DNA_START=129 /DNA_END=1241 /DNA_ORIENTATION=+
MAMVHVSKCKVAAAALVLLAALPTTTAFTAPSHHSSQPTITSLAALREGSSSSSQSSFENQPSETPPNTPNRRGFLSTIASSAIIFSGTSQSAWADGEESSSFESIAARAARVSQEVSQVEQAKQVEEEAAAQRRRELAQKIKDDPRTIYDFSLPVNGRKREVADLVGQTFETVGAGEDGTGGTVVGNRVKAILVVNIKQDDPIARKNIPELIALSTKFGKNGDFAVIVSPTDQGYYEPDTSALLRLKVEQEYGYGSTPGTILTDKVNLLGSGADPFWRWIEGNCRTPAGLGKIQANFEKFLVDGRTGKPLRRYPRKYQPYDITDDIAAVISGRPLPPAQNNFKEEWRNAAKEAENDTYRFQKGLNYFDQ